MSTPAGRSVADSVRLAWPAEAGRIAELQRRSWAELPGAISKSLLDAVDLDAMTEAWHAAITRPPQARCRVLVAVDDQRLTGYATTVPSGDSDAEDGVDGEIDQFVVDPAARGIGHGSRLLNACADTLRADGFQRASSWVAATDDGLRRFLTGAGWAPDGAHREIGSEDGDVRIKQVRLLTRLD